MAKLFIGAALMLIGSPAYSQTIADGGFDSQAASVGTYCYDGACPSGPWIDKHFIASGNPAWGSTPARSGSAFGFVQGTCGCLSQSFTAPSSGIFVVSWWETGRPAASGGGTQTVLVQVGGVQVGQGDSIPGQAWTHHVSSAFSLTAGQSYLLRLVGTAATDQTAFIDDVAILPASSTSTYSYDARGRLVGTATTNGINGGLATSYTFDHADNRTRATTTGAH